ncbi:hypothetical protein NPIL_655661 [Nephila pilipes]|uniref:Uncharacterized protein n=1 Tax=Nephila pilipes TaxID=299642 RepID=A0A8X6M7F8_NEPPI|nr:hypothetical protein NPIL_655661 [Nephila pilipes]
MYSSYTSSCLLDCSFENDHCSIVTSSHYSSGDEKFAKRIDWQEETSSQLTHSTKYLTKKKRVLSSLRLRLLLGTQNSLWWTKRFLRPLERRREREGAQTTPTFDPEGRKKELVDQSILCFLSLYRERGSRGAAACLACQYQGVSNLGRKYRSAFWVGVAGRGRNMGRRCHVSGFRAG